MVRNLDHDLPDVIPPPTSTGLYADDTKLYNALKSSQDCDHLQEAQSHADDSSKQSNIDFNISKCKVLTISCRKSPIDWIKVPSRLNRTDACE